MAQTLFGDEIKTAPDLDSAPDNRQFYTPEPDIQDDPQTTLFGDPVNVLRETPELVTNLLSPEETHDMAGKAWDTAQKEDIPLDIARRYYIPEQKISPEGEFTSRRLNVDEATELREIERVRKAQAVYDALADDQKWLVDKGYPIDFDALLKPAPPIYKSQRYGGDMIRAPYPRSQEATFKYNYNQLALDDPLKKKVDDYNQLRDTYAKIMTGLAEKQMRQFEGLWDEFGYALARGTLRVGAAFTGAVADASQLSIFDPEAIRDIADELYEGSQHKMLRPSAPVGGKWGTTKQFLANTIGDTLPYMAASVSATVVTGSPWAAFGVGFIVEGDDAYRTDIEAGASVEHAQMNRLIVGTINGAIESLQVSNIIRFADEGAGGLRAITKAAQQKAWGKVGKLGKDLTFRNLQLSLREAIEEALQESTSILAEATTDPNAMVGGLRRVGKAALGGGTVGLIIGNITSASQQGKPVDPATAAETLEASIKAGELAFEDIRDAEAVKEYLEKAAETGEQGVTVTIDTEDRVIKVEQAEKDIATEQAKSGVKQAAEQPPMSEEQQKSVEQLVRSGETLKEAERLTRASSEISDQPVPEIEPSELDKVEAQVAAEKAEAVKKEVSQHEIDVMQEELDDIDFKKIKGTITATEEIRRAELATAIVQREKDREQFIEDKKARQEVADQKIREGKIDEVTEQEFLDYNVTGTISETAYEEYEKEDGLDWLGSPEKHSLVLQSFDIDGDTITFRKKDETLQYVRHDAEGEIVRDEKGLAIYLTEDEIIEQGLPLKDTSIVAFNKDGKPVGLASNEFGADGIWVTGSYQKKGIGTKLLAEFRKQFPPSRKIGQATGAGVNLIKRYYKQLRAAQAQEAKPAQGGTGEVKGIKIGEVDITDSHSGENFGRVIAKDKDGKVVGQVQFSDFDDEISIQFIEVVPEQRRKGIASALRAKIKEAFPESEIVTFGDFETEEGTQFKEAAQAQEAKPATTEIPEVAKEKRIISKDAFDAALKRLGTIDKLKAGLDPQQIKDAAIVGGYLVETGVRNFTAWSKKMVETIGENVRPHLKSIWDDIVSAKAPPKAEKPKKKPAKKATKPRVTPVQKKAEAEKRERGFVSSVKTAMPEIKAEGVYIPRSTDELSIKAKNLVKDDINKAETVARKGDSDKSVATASELLKYYNNLAKLTADPTAKDALYEKAATIANDIAHTLTEAGRTVQAAIILTRLTPEGQVRFAAREIQKYNEKIEKKKGGIFGLKKKIPEITPEQTKFILEEMAAIEAMEPGEAKAKRFQKLQNFISDLVPTPLFKKLVTVWKTGLLTGLKTHGLNILSTAANVAAERAAKIPATAIDKVVSLITGERTVTISFKGGGRGAVQGAKRGFDYIVTGYDERNIGTKLDYKRINFGKGLLGRALNMYSGTVFRILGAEDQVFYYSVKLMSLYEQAKVAAINQKLKGKEAQKFINDLMMDPTEDMIKNASKDAEAAVFQNRTKLGDLAKGIQGLGGGAGEIVVPFGRTPSSVAMQIVNYSPAGAVKTILENIGKGKFNQRDFVTGLGRSIVGIIPLVIGAKLWKEDMLTLDYPKTERERELQKAEGRKSNSVKVDGKWRTIQSFGPEGNLLVIGGHFARAFQESGSPSEAMAQALFGSTKSFTEQTFLQGINQFTSALNDPERSGPRLARGLISSVIPTISGDIAKAIDPLERRTGSVAGRLKAKIPGLRQTLEPQITVFGEERKASGNPLEIMIDPTRPSKDISTPVVKELRRLADEGFNVSPPLLGEKAGYDVLTPKENTQLWKRTGEITSTLLTKWITSKGYKSIPNDLIKSKSIDRLVKKAHLAAKAEMVAIKLKQGMGWLELADSGLLSIDRLDEYKFYKK